MLHIFCYTVLYHFGFMVFVMTEEFFIPFNVTISGSYGWLCQQCNKFVPNIIQDDKIIPASLYWNTERHEVFCGAEHSLQRDEEIGANNGD